jgi:hypothetical protein
MSARVFGAASEVRAATHEFRIIQALLTPFQAY